MKRLLTFCLLPFYFLPVFLLACSENTETAGGGDDFPNTLATVLSQGMEDWSADRVLKSETADETASAQAKQLALVKTTIDFADTARGTVTLYSLDTLALRIVADTVTVAWDAYAKDGVSDNENVLYFSERKIRRATGAAEYQRITPLDTYVRGPGIDSSRVRLHEERDSWRVGLLDSLEGVTESLDMDLAHFTADSLRDYPLYYREVLRKGELWQENRLLMENGDTALMRGQKLLLRKVRLEGNDSLRLHEVGLEPGEQVWHGSARFFSFRAVDYAPEHGWQRTELEFIGARSYAENETLADGTFRLLVRRDDGEWLLQGTFDSRYFTGTLTGPDGQSQDVRFNR